MAELLGGLLIGFLASMAVWYVLFQRIVPSLEFFPAIYKTRTEETLSGYKYRIRFRNNGRREVLDLELFAKLRILGLSPKEPTSWRAIYIPIDDPRIPRVASQRGTKKRISFRLLVTQINEAAKAGLPPEIRVKCDAKTVLLEDLMALGKRSTLEIFGFGYDSFSSARKIFESPVYTIADIEEEKSRR